MVKIRNLTLIVGIIIGIAFIFVILFPAFQALAPFVEYINYVDDVFNLRFSPPLAVTGQESYLIKCDLRNTVNIFDSNGVIRQVIYGDSPQFSPAVQLSFIIPTSDMPEYGHATIRTLLSCDPSDLSNFGFQPFLISGSTTTTSIKGYNFEKQLLDIKSNTRGITSTVDMNGRNFYEINRIVITASDLERTLEDDFDYTSTITATTTGTLLFRQCLTSNPNCTGTDAEQVWEHSIRPNDVFTAFGLISEGAGFAPLSEVQEIQITTPLEEGGKYNIAESARVEWKVRIRNYSPQESIPIVKTYWLGNPDPVQRQIAEETRSLGTLTATEDGGTYHVKSGTFLIPSNKLGQWCFELQPDETGIRSASKKCLIAYDEEIPEDIVNPNTGDETTGTTISEGELRIRYEVQTKDKIFRNDITQETGIPITFNPLGVVGVDSPKNVIFDIFIEPQLFFNEEILENLNVLQSGSTIEYTGTIFTAEKEITIPSIDLRPTDDTFTKNPASIKLPATKITGTELEEILLRNGVSPTSKTEASLTINISGNVLLENVSTQSQWRGVLENAKFDWNFDYVPPNSDDKINGDTKDECNDQGGTIIAGTCAIPEDISQCFDSNGNEIECEEGNDTVGENSNVVNDSLNPNTAQCFDSEGNETICEEDVPEDCNVNTDPNRCGGGQIQTRNNDDPNNDIGGSTPDPKICLGLPFEQCAEASGDDIPTGEIDPSAILTQYGFIIALGVSLVIIIAVVIRVIRK